MSLIPWNLLLKQTFFLLKFVENVEAPGFLQLALIKNQLDKKNQVLLKSALGLIHTRHFDAQYCDKKIFRKKDIFKPWMSKGQGKLLRNQGKRRKKP